MLDVSSQLAEQLDGTIIRSQNAFVAAGNKVFSCLGGCKVFAEVPFTVEKLALNKSGTSLLVAGGVHVQVLNVSTKEREAVCELPSPIIDLAWHPLGVRDLCFVALVDGAVISHYLSPKGLETEILHLRPTQLGTFDATNSVEQAISIAFGHDAATGPFTLFLGTMDGDIYAVAPYIPATIHVSDEKLRGLLDFALAREYNRSKGIENPLDIDAARQELSFLSRQLKWARQLVVQFSQGPSAATFKRPNRPPPSIQGPLRLVPFPDTLYDQDVLDIANSKLENSSLMIQLMSGYVNFFLQDTPLDLSWSTKGAVSSPLSLIESVKLPKSLTEGSLQVYGEYVFVQTPDETIVLETGEWQSALAGCIQSGSPLPQLAPTKVSVEDKSIVISNRGFVTSKSVKSMAIKRWMHGSNRQPEAKPNALHAPESVSYLPLVNTDVVDQITAFLTNINLNTNMTGPLAISNNAESLKKLSNLSSKFERDMSRLFKAVSLSVQHVHLLRSELHRQLSNVRSIKDSLAKLDRESILTRAQLCVERQQKLSERAQALVQRVELGIQAPLPLNDLERRFVAEVERVDKAVSTSDESDGDSSIKTSTDSLAKRVELVVADSERLKYGSGPAEEHPAQDDLQSLKLRAFKVNSRIIELTKKLTAAGIDLEPPVRVKLLTSSS